MAEGDSVGREMETLLPDLAEAKRGGMLNIGQAAAATQQASHSVVDLLQDLGDLLVGGWGQRVEHGWRSTTS